MPDSARIVLLRSELGLAGDVLIRAAGTKILTHAPAVTSEGLRLSTDIPGWRINAPNDLPSYGFVPWASIESIQGRRGARGSGPVLGALAGFAVGLAITVAEIVANPFGGQKEPTGAPILIGFVGGAALGVAADRPGHWQHLYP